MKAPDLCGRPLELGGGDYEQLQTMGAGLFSFVPSLVSRAFYSHLEMCSKGCVPTPCPHHPWKNINLSLGAT